LKLIGTDHYGFKVSHVSDITLENIRVEDSGRTGVDLNNVTGATLSGIEVVNTVAGFGVMVFESDATLTDITTAGNPWGGVSVQTVDAPSNVTFSGSFAASEDVPLLLEKDPPHTGAITTSNIPSQFQYVVYALREGDDYMQWTYQETLGDAEALVGAFLASPSHTYGDVVIYDIAETNYYVIPGMLIQDAVDAATAGDTVNVAAGTYVEQVEIAKELTLQGAGSGTIIESPDNLTLFYTSSSDNYPIVYVHDTDGVTIRDLTVDGAGKGNANYRFQGIGYRNAGGTVDSVEVLDVRDTPFSGAQHGVALYVYNTDGQAREINVWDSTFSGFQKNAMALNANDTTPLTVDVRRNTVIGAGATTVTAQNGIQVWADLGSGTIANNTVSGIAYDDSSWVATSILSYYADLDIVDNTITGAHMGIYVIEGQGSIAGNNLTIEKIGGAGYGVIATDPPEAVPSPITDEDPEGKRLLDAGPLSGPLVLVVSNNVVSTSAADNVGTYGILAEAGYSPSGIDFTADGNAISGFQVGIYLWQCQGSCDTGTFTSASANYNDLSNNTYAIYSNVTVDGEYNWWDDPTGPSGEGPGRGDIVSDYVDYSPWCTNAACTTFAEEVVIPDGTSDDDIKTIVEGATSYSIITLPNEEFSVAGGFVLNNPYVTVKLQAGTVINASSPCFTVNADDTTITSVDVGGVCRPSGGDHGIVVGAPVNNLVVRGFEIDGSTTTTGDGIHIAYDVTNLQILELHIHDMGSDGIEYASGVTVSGVHEVQGNLFQDNADTGINNVGGPEYDVTYNSWGDVSGPNGTDGDGVSGNLDFTPWTHVDLSLATSGTPVADKVALNDLITYQIVMDAEEVYGADFTFDFDETYLTVDSITDSGLFAHPGTCDVSSVAEANANGAIDFCGQNNSEVAGTGQVVLTVVFEGTAAGVAHLNFPEDSDTFAMAPPSGASNWIYASALGETTVTVYELAGVSGRIDLQGRADDSGATLSFAEGDNQGYGPYAGTTGYWGTVTLSDVVYDSYVVTVSMERYLDVTVASGKSFTVDELSETLATLTLFGGDTDGDGAISTGDAATIGGAYGTIPGDAAWQADADINADDAVDVLDLVILGGNYDLTSVTAYAWTP
jgi:hypothetical protein